MTEEIKNVKQVIVIRKDLNMRKGKMIAQGSHASLKDLLYKFRNLKSAAEKVFTLQIFSYLLGMIGIFIGIIWLGNIIAHTILILIVIAFGIGQMFSFEKLLTTLLMTDAERLWYFGNFRKICVYVNSEAELMDVYNKAIEKGLKVHLIEDKGLTEFKGVLTKTCLAIGPHFDSDIDEITKKLTLL